MAYTLAEAVRTDVDYPPFDRSIMDGFAVRAQIFFFYTRTGGYKYCMVHFLSLFLQLAGPFPDRISL